MIEIILKYLEPIAIIVASGATVYALTSWRREIKGKREYEVAEETLCLFYEAADKIRDIRCPYISSEEVKDDNENPFYAEVIFVRLRNHNAFFNKFNIVKNRFIANFGSENKGPFDDLVNIIADIRIAANGICSLWQANKNEPKNSALHKKYGEALEKYLPVIQAGENPDPINERVEKMISKAEYICRPKMGR
jgi:hypothetical protein